MGLELLKSVTGRTLIESHRGIEGLAPENSWPAIKMGHELGADLIEVDVQMSQDGIPFLRHNYQLPDERWCSQLSWDVLKDIKIDREPLPLLEDVLVWAREASVVLSLDIKTFFSPAGALTKKAISLLKRTNMINKVQLLFVDHNELLDAKLTQPDLTTRALITGRLVNYPEYLQKIKADSVSVSYGMFHPFDIEQIHSIGASVILGGLWNPRKDLFQEMEIDMLSYGNPVEARKILEH